MRTDKFTVKTQEAIAAAQGSAERLGQQAVDVEHVLVALLQQVPIRQRLSESSRRGSASCLGSAAGSPSRPM
jgi:ATP-dependent Clp protease ATP-binding subunit ClpA